MRIIGIDPGVTGAIACLKDGKAYWLADMPVDDGFINGLELGVLLGEADAVFVEKTHAMPKNGGLANFSSGYSQGAICAIVQSLQVPLHRVLPNAWKKNQGLLGRDKEASRALAKNLYPDFADSLKRKKDHNRAEAILIARYGLGQIIQEANQEGYP